MTTDELATTLDEVRQHPTFRNHAAAFASAIGMAVESLDDWDGDLTATLLQLGRMHSETQGFTVQNFEIFAESLFHVWETRLEQRAGPHPLKKNLWNTYKKAIDF